MFLNVLDKFDRAIRLESDDDLYLFKRIRATIASKNAYLKNCFNSEKKVSLKNQNNKVIFCACDKEAMQKLSKLMQLTFNDKTLKLFDYAILISDKSANNLLIKACSNIFKDHKTSYLMDYDPTVLSGNCGHIFEHYKLDSQGHPRALAKINGCLEVIEIR